MNKVILIQIEPSFIAKMTEEMIDIHTYIGEIIVQMAFFCNFAQSINLETIFSQWYNFIFSGSLLYDEPIFSDDIDDFGKAPKRACP